MAMIVESGVGIANSNSYVSLTDADDYHTLYSQLEWAGDDTTKENALIVATRVLDALYGDKFLSYKVVNSTDLLWPRYPFYDNNGLMQSAVIPKAIKDATCELALKYLLGEDVYVSANNEINLSENTIKIEDLEITNKYRSQVSSEIFTGFNKIEMFLKSVLKPKNKTVTLWR